MMNGLLLLIADSQQSDQFSVHLTFVFCVLSIRYSGNSWNCHFHRMLQCPLEICAPSIDIDFGNVIVTRHLGLMPLAINSRGWLILMGKIEMFWPAWFLRVMEIWIVNGSWAVDEHLAEVTVLMVKQMQLVVYLFDSMNADRCLNSHFSAEINKRELTEIRDRLICLMKNLHYLCQPNLWCPMSRPMITTLIFAPRKHLLRPNT